MNIPENEKIDGFEYGAHWSTPGRSGWYVRKSDGPWVQARSTPAPNELPDDYDEAYREAVAELPDEERNPIRFVAANDLRNWIDDHMPNDRSYGAEVDCVFGAIMAMDHPQFGDDNWALFLRNLDLDSLVTKREYVVEQYVRCIQRVLVTAVSPADAIARLLRDGEGVPDGEPEYLGLNEDHGIFPEEDSELCEEAERLGVVLGRPHGYIPSIRSVEAAEIHWSSDYINAIKRRHR